MDKLYGKPSSSKIAASIEEKGFDKTLDEYSDESRKAKERLLSDSKVSFILGLTYLDNIFFDGGHTVFTLPLIDASDSYADTAVGSMLNDKLNDFNDPEAMMVIWTMMLSIKSEGKKAKLIENRKEASEKYEVIKTWDDASGSQLIIGDDTAVFSFNSFMNEAVDHFKWSLDYAKEKGVKRFVLDVSCNSGGSNSVVMYMMAMMTNKNRNNNTAYMRTFMTVDGNITENTYEIDLNLDGEFNELDKEVYYDFEYAVLTSGVSFSCGNLLPALAKDNGIAVIGETSGGGSCSLLINFTPEVMSYTISSYEKFISNDNTDIDSGITPDYVLTKESVNQFGETITDYSGLYDIAAYSTIIDEFYGVTNDPSEVSSEESSEEPSEEPSDDPSEKQSEDPSDVPSEKTSDVPSKKAAEEQHYNSYDTHSVQSSDAPVETNTPATGDNGFEVVYILLTVIAAGIVISLTVVSRKRERS